MYHYEWLLMVQCVMEIMWRPLQPMQVVDTVKVGLKIAFSSLSADTRRSKLILEPVCRSKGADRF